MTTLARLAVTSPRGGVAFGNSVKLQTVLDLRIKTICQISTSNAKGEI